MRDHSQPKTRPSIAELQDVFQLVLPPQVIRELVKVSGRRFYVRLLTPLILVWCLIYQRLHADHTCSGVVSYLESGGADRLEEGRSEPLSRRLDSVSNSAYCQGRQRLPLSVLEGALAHTTGVMQAHLSGQGSWLGHVVYLLDGSTLLLRPEPELVEHYGQHRNQHGRTYWVLMRIVVAFCLHSGSVVRVAEGSVHESEQALAHSLLAHSAEGAVYVADCNFGVYSVAQMAQHRQQNVVFRLRTRQARAIAKRQWQSGDDILLAWVPGRHTQRLPNLPADPIPGRLLYVRLGSPGFRPVDLYLFTNLLDRVRYPLAELVALYGRRWHVELNLRYLKSTLDLNLLPGKSVAIVRKELTAALLAYNLIRACMVLAACRAHIAPLTLSFTEAWRRIRDAWLTLPHLSSSRRLADAFNRLLDRLARCRLPKQVLNRIEPRAVRRRPAVYPNLKGQRDRARQLTLAKLLAWPNS